MGNIFDIINVPFGMLLSFFYSITDNYAVTLLLFTIAVQIILLPFGIRQQKSQIKMAKIKPKEQVIRKKYAGRTDAATNQKMQQEVMEMYKRENFSPMSGCLPMLIQFPIIIALYNIVRQPLTYIAGFSTELVNTLKEFMIANQERFSDFIKAGVDARGIQEIDIVKVFADNLDSIKSSIDLTGIGDAGLFETFENLKFGFLGQSLLNSPSTAFLSVLMLIPILNFAATFLQTRLTRMMQAKSALNDTANNKSMKIMEYTMPLMIVYFTYTMPAALGLYWIYRSIVSIAQTIILSRVYPIPEVTEADLKFAEEQYGGKVKKQKKKKPAELSSGDENSDDEPEDNLDENSEKTLKNSKEKQNNDDIYDDETVTQSKNSEKSSKWDSYLKQREEDGGEKTDGNLSNTMPQGTNTGMKKNYQKTGKKYTVKRRNSDK